MLSIQSEFNKFDTFVNMLTIAYYSFFFPSDALEKAQILLTMKHGIAHLHNVWGVGGGNRPVKNLKNKVSEV